jgi:hypothetical protein
LSHYAIEKATFKYAHVNVRIPEEELFTAFHNLRGKLAPLWEQSMVISNSAAALLLQMDKSPGFPWFFKYKDKGETLIKAGAEVFLEVDAFFLNGQGVFVFAETLKVEIRALAKVLEQNTRAFVCCDIVHLMCSLRLFQHQNDVLTRNWHNLPFKIGIPSPSPFISSLLMEGEGQFCDFDGSGWDTRFPLQIAALICAIRASFLPGYHKHVRSLYDAVYGGLVFVNGNLYRLLHNKSGWLNTAMDNSLYMYIALFIGFMHVYPDFDFEELWLAIYSDDGIMAYQKCIDFKLIVSYLESLNIVLEVNYHDSPLGRTFLSQTLVSRLTSANRYQMVCGGNILKLQSSTNWFHKPRGEATPVRLIEAELAHFIGLRLVTWAHVGLYQRVCFQVQRLMSILAVKTVSNDLFEYYHSSIIPEKQVEDMYLSRLN